LIGEFACIETVFGEENTEQSELTQQAGNGQGEKRKGSAARMQG
jgi:hypothetical protein